MIIGGFHWAVAPRPRLKSYGEMDVVQASLTGRGSFSPRYLALKRRAIFSCRGETFFSPTSSSTSPNFADSRRGLYNAVPAQ